MRGAFILICLFSMYLNGFTQTIRKYTVILRSNTGTHTLHDGNVVKIYGFASTLSAQPILPGKTLYANEGDSVIITARNISQGSHHTIHLHGLDVDTRNDGDPATSFELAHMEDTTYSFRATHAGTYLYHCHAEDVVHVQMGMYGLLVVKAKDGANTAWTGGPAFDREYKWLTSEIDTSWHSKPPKHDTVSMTIKLPPYMPQYFLINGRSQQQLQHDSTMIKGSVNEKIYFRVSGIGYFMNRIVFPTELNAEIIDTDGRPFPAAVSSDTIEFMPGERYGVMLTPSAEYTGTIPVQFINMNTDSVWTTEQIPVSISGQKGMVENQEELFKIFPNPVTDILNIDFSSFDESGIIKVLDLTGKEVLKREIERETSVSIPVGQLPKGTYLLQLEKNKSTHSQLFIVE